MFILTVQETGFSTVFLVWVPATARDWERALEWTGHCWLLRLVLPPGTGMSDIIIESIILTILVICWVGAIIGPDIGAIMKGSVRISLNTVLKKVIVPSSSNVGTANQEEISNNINM